MFRMILRRVRDGRAADYADLRHVDRIGVFAVAFVVLGAIIGAGYALLVVPGLILTTIWIYALPLVADRDCSVSEAMAESRELAAAPGYMNTFAAWLVGALVVGAVAAVVSAIPVIGLVIGLLAAPYFTAYIVSMYFQAIGQGHRIDTALR